VNGYLDAEDAFGIRRPDVFETFISDCNSKIKVLLDFLDGVNNKGEKIYIYGATVAGNCFLQYANIGESMIPFVVDRDSQKIGKTTSTGIKIISEDTMNASPPNYLLVLSSYFRNDIVKNLESFLEDGGKIVFPFPTFEILEK
jgi:FlaA1/EpsC-like NDP-sugar epimerase